MKILIGFIVIGASFANLDPAQKKFIDELNGIRKEVAANLTITNMHKLEYSKNLAGKAARGEKVAGYHESWRHTWVTNYSKGRDELLREFDRYYETWVDGQPPNKSIEVQGLARPVEHLVPLHTKIGCALMIKTPYAVICSLGPEGSLDSFYTSLNNTGLNCSSGYLFIDGLCSPEDDIEVKYGSVQTQLPVIESSQSVEMTTESMIASQHLETLKPDNHLPTAPPVGNISAKLGTRLSKNSSQTEDSTNSTVNPYITPAPFIYGPKTTVETELDRHIAKYQREEQDGDLPSEEDKGTYGFSGCGKVSVVVSLVFVMTSLLIE
ncbi:hypothetical protein CAEBREN_19563 [Caenorhabditis brenneri]|uniref:SCP domain-containing protein n=1 Tax=Caenorhabditis brenneri TaxID=135651 RepID=G0MDC6_CAEBE|nr:hypothetical protein CAEBREN_19563 [Caenorhabditis brenneri]